MSFVVYVVIVVVIVAIAVLAIVFIGWRVASRFWKLPCPSLLAWTFEGSFADWVSGTEVTLDRMQVAPGQTVLEVGPGPGRLLIPAARRVLPDGRAIGIDIQPKMIARLNERATQAGIMNLTTAVGDATRLDLPADSVDLAYLSTVLGEVPDRAAALAECFRVVRPGGMLAITEIIGDPHYQSRKKVKQLATAAGFYPQHVEGGWRMYTATFRKPTFRNPCDQP